MNPAVTMATEELLLVKLGLHFKGGQRCVKSISLEVSKDKREVFSQAVLFLIQRFKKKKSVCVKELN